MPVRPDKRSIPALSQAIERFLSHRRRETKDIRGDASVLRGAQRVVGRKAAGPALAKSELGPLRCDRVSDWELSDWFEDRHEGLSHNARRRGMFALRNLLRYCIRNGWIDDGMLEHFQPLPKTQQARDWLHPEQVVALIPLVESAVFDDYQRFAFFTLLCTGVRPAELVELRASDLDPRSRTLLVRHGKGAGGGKPRNVPVDDDYIARWQEHRQAHAIRPNGWMLFRRSPRFVGGASRLVEWVEDRSQHATAAPVRRMLAHHESDQRACSLQALAQAELPPDLAPAFQLTPYVLRRTFACLALVEHALNPGGGWDLRTLQRAMGHHSLEVTQIYLSDVERYLDLKRERFNPLEAAARAARVRATS